jgi:hypothetical protein
MMLELEHPKIWEISPNLIKPLESMGSMMNFGWLADASSWRQVNMGSQRCFLCFFCWVSIIKGKTYPKFKFD